MMCGIFGCSGIDNAIDLTLRGLFCLQHRGQESSGVFVWNPRTQTPNDQRRVGYVSHLREKLDSDAFPGTTAIGHVRYGTIGGSSLRNAQPLAKGFMGDRLAIAHNGDLVKVEIDGQIIPIITLRQQWEKEGVVFETTSDTEILFSLIARSPKPTFLEKVIDVLDRLYGAFSLLLSWKGYLIAVRDPWGFRPLALGRCDSGVAFASENCAFDQTGIEFVRNLKPGEVMIVSPQREETIRQISRRVKPACCSFEFVYLARPDSFIFDQSVSDVRKRFGIQTALEMIELGILPLDALVVPVLDSGRDSALTVAQVMLWEKIKRLVASGADLSQPSFDFFPLDFGFIRNHYSGRNFITPGQEERKQEVSLKHNVNPPIVKDQEILVVDDSIVRATTSKKHVSKLRQAGAERVHVAIPSPRITHSCPYGIDTKKREELIAATCSLEETRQRIGADSLYHLSIEGFRKALGCPDQFCLACFDGDYPIPLDTN